MNKINFLAACVIVLLSSCVSKPYYQICKISSNLEKTTDNVYAFNNSQIEIGYDFWSEGGIFSFIITNKTDEIINIDLSKSFFIKNGVAHDYFLDRIATSSNSISSSISSSGTATGYGFWNYFGKKIPGSASITTADNQGIHKSSSISFREKSIISLPPNSSKIIAEYSIMKNHYRDCDLYESPSKKEESILTFTANNTPVTIVNYLTYTVGNNSTEQTVENSFYISQISNQHYDATIHEEKVGCDSDWHKTKKSFFNNASADEFYIKYTPKDQDKNETNVTKNGQKKKQSQLYAPESIPDPIYN